MWFAEHLGFYPDEFMPLNPNMWIQRRNVQPVETGGYVCESRKLNNEEYSKVKTQIEEVKRIIQDLTDSTKYEEGYNAAMILLGETE